jgi:hypothetical protein
MQKKRHLKPRGRLKAKAISSRPIPSDDVGLQAQMHLAEYEAIQRSLSESRRIQNQILVIGLGAISIAIPILLGQATQLPPTILAALLYAVAIVFAALTMNYVIVFFDYAQASAYLRRHLAPELNRIAAGPPERRVMDFERQVGLVRRKPLGLFLANVGPIATEIVLLLPAFLSMVAARYILLLQPISSAQTAAEGFVGDWLRPLAAIAWVSLILTILTFIGCTVFWIASGYLEEK